MQIGNLYSLTSGGIPEHPGKWVVYLLSSSKTPKRYVGITSNLKRRTQDHIKNSSYARYVIARAIKKYGKDSFTVEVIALEDSLEIAASLEQALILDMGTKIPDGYNVTFGGEGVILSDRQKEHRINAVIESYKRPEVIANMKKRDSEKWSNPDFRKAHRLALAEANKNPSYSANRRAARIRSGLVSPVVRDGSGEVFDTVSDAAKSIGRSVSLVIHTCKLDDCARMVRASKGLPNFRYLNK